MCNPCCASCLLLACCCQPCAALAPQPSAMPTCNCPRCPFLAERRLGCRAATSQCARPAPSNIWPSTRNALHAPASWTRSSSRGGVWSSPMPGPLIRSSLLAPNSLHRCSALPCWKAVPPACCCYTPVLPTRPDRRGWPFHRHHCLTVVRSSCALRNLLCFHADVFAFKLAPNLTALLLCNLRLISSHAALACCDGRKLPQASCSKVQMGTRVSRTAHAEQDESMHGMRGMHGEPCCHRRSGTSGGLAGTHTAAASGGLHWESAPSSVYQHQACGMHCRPSQLARRNLMREGGNPR